MFGSAFMLGWSVTLAFVPRLGDIYGRKRLFIIGMACDLIIYSIVIITNKLNVMITMMFFFGAFTSIRIAIGYIYVMELTPKKGQTLFGIIFCVVEGSILVWAILYFTMSVSKNWLYYAMIGYCM